LENLFLTLLSLTIFAATLALVFVKPLKLGIGVWAMAGALVSLLLGISTLHSIIVVWNIIWNATFTFVAIIIITLIFDEAGFFEFIAVKLSLLCGGNTYKLFISIMLLTSVVSALFANDGAAMVMTPIVVAITRAAGFDSRGTLAFVMSVGFIADTGSIPLVTSNLVNIVTAGYFHLSFAAYFIQMAVPDAISVLSSIFFLFLLYRGKMGRIYSTKNIPDARMAVKDRRIFRIAFPATILMIASYVLGSAMGLPVSFIAILFCLAIILLARKSNTIKVAHIVRYAPWQIVFFSLGMYIIVYGVSTEGTGAILSNVVLSISHLIPPFQYLSMSFLSASLSAIMNNMPSTLVTDIAIGHSFFGERLVYSSVIGNDIGPKFTPIGSLATLLWLYTLERKESIKITALEYMRTGLILAIPVLLLTSFALLLP